jgi:PAS domain S-box-containing protein
LTTRAAENLKLAARAFALAAAYLTCMVVAVELTRFGADVSPIWPASAVLAWALISSKLEDWPVHVGMTALAHVGGAFLVGDQLPVEAIYLVANLASPLALAGLLRWRGEDLAFSDRDAVVRFLALGGIVAPGLSAGIVGLAGLAMTGAFNARTTFLWFMSDGLSFIVFLPIFRSLASRDWRSLVAPKIRMRALTLFSILVAAHAVAWFLPYRLHSIFTISLIPYLIFMTFQLGVSGARVAITVSATAIIGQAWLAPGFYTAALPVDEYLLAVQLYTAALVVCVLPLAEALAEKQRLYERVSATLEDAQAAWGELIAAEAHYRLIADNADSMVMRVGLDGAIIFASPACRLIVGNSDEVEGRAFIDLVHADDAARVHADIGAFIGRGVIDLPHTIHMRLRDAQAGWRPFDVRTTLIAPGGRKAEEFIAVLKEAA